MSPIDKLKPIRYHIDNYYEERRYRVTLEGKLGTLANVTRVITPSESDLDPVADYTCNCTAFTSGLSAIPMCNHIQKVIDWIEE